MVAQGHASLVRCIHNLNTLHFEPESFPGRRGLRERADVLMDAALCCVDEILWDPRRATSPYRLPPAASDREQLGDIGDIDMLLDPHIFSNCDAMIGPRLELEQELRYEGHDGDGTNGHDVSGWDVGDVHDAWREDVDLALPSKSEAVPEYSVARQRALRRDGIEAAIPLGQQPLQSFLPVHRCEDYNVRVIRTPSRAI